MHLAGMTLNLARRFEAVAALVDVLGNDKRVILRPEGNSYPADDGQPTGGHPLLRLSPALLWAFDPGVPGVPGAPGADGKRRVAPVGAVDAAKIDGVYLNVTGWLDAGHEALAPFMPLLERGQSVACAARIWTARPCLPDADGIVRLVDWRLTGLLIGPDEPIFEEARLWTREEQTV